MDNAGIGSSSIVLVFSVLCLAIFAVISLMPAMTEQTLIERELELVRSFYAADTLAEKVLAEILSADEVPESFMGIEIFGYWDFDLMAEVVDFSIPITDYREVYVTVIIEDDSYKILNWYIRNVAEWETETFLNVWQGF